MRFRFVITLCVVAWAGLVGHGALAASYQKTDGTIVDPMTSAFCQGEFCTYPSPYEVGEIHPFPGPPLAPGVRIYGADLYFADLRDADLHEADVRTVDFSYSDLNRIDLRGADLRSLGGYNFWPRNADMDHIDLRRATTLHKSFSNSDLHGARMDGLLYQATSGLAFSNLSGATMRNSYVNDDSSVGGANFQGADLRGSHFYGLSFGYVNLDRADLRGVYLSATFNMGGSQGTPYYDSTTSFDQVLTGSRQDDPLVMFDPVAAGWINLDLVDVDSDGTADSTDNCRFSSNTDQADGDADAIGDACDFSPSTTCLEMGALEKSTTTLLAFQDNTCQDWSWTEQPAAFLQSAVLTETYLRSANLSGAVMTNANLAGADLTAVHLVNAYLANADLRSAVLAYAHLTFTDLTGANLAHADLESADLAEAQLTSAQYDEATVFPSGHKVTEPPWGLPNDVTPWDAGMIPVPEPGSGSGSAIMIGCAAIGLAGVARRARG